MEVLSRQTYLDNAATTYPKPEAVYRAMDHFAREVGGSPGRSGHHRSLEAGREVLRARDAVARLFGIDDPSRIVFTKNATEALNLVIQGVLTSGGHAVITSLEHNSVWRPLEAMARAGTSSYSIVEGGPDGLLDPSLIEEALLPSTRLVVCTHASNVTGSLLPICDIAELCARRGIPLLVDAAQTAGRYVLDPVGTGIQYLAFTGHKELFGPQGTGGLYVAPGWEVEPLLYGGTGSRSESSLQPDFLPDRCESGTLNAMGLAGLRAGVGFVTATGVDEIRRHEGELFERLSSGLLSLRGVTMYGPPDWESRVGLVLFNIKGLTSSEVASRLDAAYGICVRSGLHCSPLAHRTIGTLENGAVRASFSYQNTGEDVDCLLDALSDICRSR
ncbi:MAG: aminotransferase class V-fold PLP-dependent enzyme [Actinobacteria bacterium]|jgi:cysteine desulfurase family protein|nr:MAG: aminotransferase class V-fold PLP-dependent enzyme [Actinomycetota bacterium]